MDKRSSLSTLIDLAKDDADKVGKQLQNLSSERQKAESQLSALQGYRQDYALRLQQATESGVSASNYQNFRRFIATLDEAIQQQNRVVAQIDTRIEDGRQQWMAQQRRLNSYETLERRHVQQQLTRELRREQRLSDEQAANAYRRLQTH